MRQRLLGCVAVTAFMATAFGCAPRTTPKGNHEPPASGVKASASASPDGPVAASTSCTPGPMTYLGFGGPGPGRAALVTEIRARFPHAVIVIAEESKVGIVLAEGLSEEMRKQQEAAAASVGWTGNTVDFPMVASDCTLTFIRPVPLPPQRPLRGLASCRLVCRSQVHPRGHAMSGVNFHVSCKGREMRRRVAILFSSLVLGCSSSAPAPQPAAPAPAASTTPASAPSASSPAPAPSASAATVAAPPASCGDVVRAINRGIDDAKRSIARPDADGFDALGAVYAKLGRDLVAMHVDGDLGKALSQYGEMSGRVAAAAHMAAAAHRAHDKSALQRAQKAFVEVRADEDAIIGRVNEICREAPDPAQPVPAAR